MKARKTNGALLVHDFLLIGVSIAIAVSLVKTGVVATLLSYANQLELLASFVAGFFFTSIFTTAPAIAALGQLALLNDVWVVALLGAAGAVVGDLLIFRFVRDQFSAHVVELVGHRRIGRRLTVFFHHRLFRWVSFFVGGLVIASPLPDEVGISLLGFSHMKTGWFIPLSFVFNFVGIVLIGLVARAL